MRTARAALVAAALLCACAEPSAQASEPASAPTVEQEFGAVLARHQRMNERVARISRALRVANAPLCTDTRLDAGLTTHRLSDYPEPLRPLALRFLPLGDRGRFVRGVVPGSPADESGVRPGDRVITGWPLDADQALVLDAGPGDEEAYFELSAPPDTACRAPVTVVENRTPSASTDGREIRLTTALVEEVGDDGALAFVIAHEMSHILRGHDAPGWRAELEADADALVLMRNAGFDTAEVVANWEAGVDAYRHAQATSLTHPPIDVRLKNLQTALDVLDAKGPGLARLSKD